MVTQRNRRLHVDIRDDVCVCGERQQGLSLILNRKFHPKGGGVTADKELLILHATVYELMCLCVLKQNNMTA